MTRKFWLLGSTLIAAIAPVVSTPQALSLPEKERGSAISQDMMSQNPMSKLVGVSQLQDVQVEDWAYQALSDLVNRYGCIAGYPNNTFRGDRSLSRYEFAAGLNACLQSIERLFAETTDQFARREDLTNMRRLMEEFEIELATLSRQVDNLEARTSFLEDNQFSTTTKLYGQVVMGLQGRDGGNSDFISTSIPGFVGIPLNGRDGIAETPDGAGEVTFAYNAQLTLLTQFNPRSFLLTGLQAGNLSTTDTTLFGFNNTFTRLGYELDTNNDLLLSDLSYRQVVTDDLAIAVGTAGINPVNVFRGPSRIESAGFGPLSRFAQRNPIIQIGFGTAGLGFDWQISDNLSLQGVYAANASNDANQGLFNGGYVAGVQLFATPLPTVDVAVNYLQSYSGASLGFLGTGVGDDRVSAFLDSRLSTDAVGATLNWAIIPEVEFLSWFGYTDSSLVSHSGNVQTVNWMFGLNFPDLGGEDNYGAVFFGQPPRITGSNLRNNGVLSGNIPSVFAGTFGVTTEGRSDRTFHSEALYYWRISDNIAITPGVIVIFNPSHNTDSDTIAIGAIRTTLTF